MPLEVADAGLSLAEQHVANMLADSAAFRTWAGAADDETARRRLYFDALPPPAGDAGLHSRDELVGYRPFAIIFTAEEQGYKRTRGATGCYVESGMIGVQLEANVPEKYCNDHQQVMRQFKNSLGRIIDELELLAYQPEYLAVNSFDLARIARESEDAVAANGDNVFAFLMLGWGAD